MHPDAEHGQATERHRHQRDRPFAEPGHGEHVHEGSHQGQYRSVDLEKKKHKKVTIHTSCAHMIYVLRSVLDATRRPVCGVIVIYGDGDATFYFDAARRTR